MKTYLLRTAEKKLDVADDALRRIVRRPCARGAAHRCLSTVGEKYLCVSCIAQAALDAIDKLERGDE